jgi:hypothetical protein
MDAHAGGKNATIVFACSHTRIHTGGKNASIVFADCDMQEAVVGAVRAACITPMPLITLIILLKIRCVQPSPTRDRLHTPEPIVPFALLLSCSLTLLLSYSLALLLSCPLALLLSSLALLPPCPLTFSRLQLPPACRMLPATSCVVCALASCLLPLHIRDVRRICV